MEGTRRSMAWVGRLVLASVILGVVVFALPAAHVAAGDVMVAVGPHGTDVSVGVYADQPKKYIVSVSTAAIIGGPLNPTFSGDKVDGATFGMKQDAGWWIATVPGLQPNTTYHYILKITDPDQTRGLPYFYRTGSFKTKQRVVTVKFASVEIIDDSDDLSQGDFWFYYKVNGVWYGRDEHDIPSGSSAQLNRTVVVNDAPSTLKFAVQAVDVDCGPLSPCNFKLIPPFDVEAAETADLDWATAYSPPLPVDLDDADPDYKKPRSFTVGTTAHKVKFKAHGTYTVAYT